MYKCNILECVDDKNKEFPYFTPILSFPPHFPTSGVISQIPQNSTNSGRKILFMGQA